MPKTISVLLAVLLCAALVAATAICLTLDGLWDTRCAEDPAQAPTQNAGQQATLPTEPLPQKSQSQVIFEDGAADFWAGCPDGIRIETIRKQYFLAHVMLIRDPGAVYLTTSTDHFSLNHPGGRLPAQLKAEGALAAINAGAFNDDGTSSDYVGSLPIGMVVSEGEILWDDGKNYYGFVGMTRENKLYVSDTINRAAVEELGIRDGCCFGPVLIKDGVSNTEKVHDRSVKNNRNSRTAIGQRGDGSVVFVCIDGRQVGSIGATFDELLALMEELECVNACTLDGGASTVMAYKDTEGRYGKAGEIVTCSSYSLFQAAPRRMPTFFMVRPGEED